MLYPEEREQVIATLQALADETIKPIYSSLGICGNVDALIQLHMDDGHPIIKFVRDVTGSIYPFHSEINKYNVWANEETHPRRLLCGFLAVWFAEKLDEDTFWDSLKYYDLED